MIFNSLSTDNQIQYLVEAYNFTASAKNNCKVTKRMDEEMDRIKKLISKLSKD